MTDIEKKIVESIRKKAEDLGYTEEMTDNAIDMALALHRGGWREIREKRRKKK